MPEAPKMQRPVLQKGSSVLRLQPACHLLQPRSLLQLRGFDTVLQQRANLLQRRLLQQRANLLQGEPGIWAWGLLQQRANLLPGRASQRLLQHGANLLQRRLLQQRAEVC